jgi:hypothetical protein
LLYGYSTGAIVTKGLKVERKTLYRFRTEKNPALAIKSSEHAQIYFSYLKKAAGGYEEANQSLSIVFCGARQGSGPDKSGKSLLTEYYLNIR